MGRARLRREQAGSVFEANLQSATKADRSSKVAAEKALRLLMRLSAPSVEAADHQVKENRELNLADMRSGNLWEGGPVATMRRLSRRKPAQRVVPHRF